MLREFSANVRSATPLRTSAQRSRFDSQRFATIEAQVAYDDIA